MKKIIPALLSLFACTTQIRNGDSSSGNNSSAAPINPPDNALAVDADSASIRYEGRIDFSDPKSPLFDWPGISFQIAFKGRNCWVKLTDGGNDYNVFVDGQFVRKIVTDHSQTVYCAASDLSNTVHTVLISKRNEASYGTAVFKGFLLDNDAEIQALPAVPSRKIEVIGDSISCGYGNEGTSITCASLRDTENNYETYCQILARSLDAECRVIAHSGKGVIRNYGSPNTTSPDPMPLFYGRTVEARSDLAWNFASWIPDLVIICLGHNDLSTSPAPSKSQFLQGYESLYQKIRTHYPLAGILCTGLEEGSLQSYLDEFVQNKNSGGDSNIFHASMGSIYSGEFGCDYHPTVSAHRRIAKNILLPFITNAMKW